MILLKIVRKIFPSCTSALNSHSRPSAQVEKTAGQLHLKHIDILTNLKEIRGLQAFRKIVNYTCGVRLEWGVCGRAFNSSNSFSEGPGFKPRQSRNFPRQLRNFSLLCLSSPRCMNGYRQHTAGGEPCDGLASRPGGSSNTPRLASCYGNRYKLRPCGSLGRVRLYLLPLKAPLDVSLCASLSFSILFTITQKENSMLWVN